MRGPIMRTVRVLLRKYIRTFWLALVACVLAASRILAAEPPFERGAELIRNELRIAATGIRALAVAAHPDDEDGATLSYLRHAGCETHICFCTRGEGGQNESGPEVRSEEHTSELQSLTNLVC